MLEKEKEAHVFFNKTDNYLHKNFGVKVRANIVKDILKDIHGKSILDMGCGNGGVSLQFAANNDLTLVDLSENMLTLAKKNAHLDHQRNIKFICASLSDFNSNEKYDVIFAIGLLAHVPSPNAAIAKLHSYLSEEGILILQFSDYDSLLTKMRVQLGKEKHSVNAITRREMLDIVKQNHLIVEKEVQYSFLPPGTGKLPNNVLYNFTMLTYKNKWLSTIGSDFIWKLSVAKV